MVDFQRNYNMAHLSHPDIMKRMLPAAKIPDNIVLFFQHLIKLKSFKRIMLEVFSPSYSTSKCHARVHTHERWYNHLISWVIKRDNINLHLKKTSQMCISKHEWAKPPKIKYYNFYSTGEKTRKQRDKTTGLWSSEKWGNLTKSR